MYLHLPGSQVVGLNQWVRLLFLGSGEGGTHFTAKNSLGVGGGTSERSFSCRGNPALISQ